MIPLSMLARHLFACGLAVDLRRVRSYALLPPGPAPPRPPSLQDRFWRVRLEYLPDAGREAELIDLCHLSEREAREEHRDLEAVAATVRRLARPAGGC